VIKQLLSEIGISVLIRLFSAPTRQDQSIADRYFTTNTGQWA